MWMLENGSITWKGKLVREIIVDLFAGGGGASEGIDEILAMPSLSFLSPKKRIIWLQLLALKM